MPKLTGIFEELDGLDGLSIEGINKFLSQKEHVYVLENYLGNRILYPQTIPVSKRDMDIDLAILCAYMHEHQDLYYMRGLKRIMIPEKIEFRFPPLANLLFFFPEIFNLEEMVEIAIKKDSSQVVIIGTIISPQKRKVRTEKLTKIMVNGEKAELDPHGITFIESEENSNEVELPDETLTVAGGKIGIIINQKMELTK